jgi:hypothetical protein
MGMMPMLCPTEDHSICIVGHRATEAEELLFASHSLPFIHAILKLLLRPAMPTVFIYTGFALLMNTSSTLSVSLVECMLTLHIEYIMEIGGAKGRTLPLRQAKV